MSGAHEWLNLVEVSGPFLAVPVLRDAFPQGLEELDAGRARRLRSAYDEWRDAVDAVDPALDALHDAWVAEVLRTALDLDESTLRAGDEAGDSVRTLLAEHDHTVVPEFVVVDPTRGHSPILPVHVFPPDTDLDATRRFDGLRSSAGDRMALQLRALGIPVGLVTNGERWMVVHAPVGHVATFASWYARLWGQERSTLRAFVSLLGVRRFFGPADERLPSLFERSLEHQDEVTEALGEQVRRAVEVLVQALDRADVDRNRELLRDVGPGELYEAGLTIMMRLVFLLAAEERGLLLLGEPRYDSFYAVSTLRMQLRAESEEILERRRSAWSRLLAVFRAVFGGIDHPTLRLPALGGSLFDPDRFPFLEGRAKGTSWKTDLATPLPIDDRTVLLLLDAIQTFKGRTLSYRALDIEQIGHVYEGLLERTVERVHDVTIELEHAKSAKNPTLTLGELESARLDGPKALLSLLVERTGRSKPAVSKAIGLDLDGQLEARLLASCRGDVDVRDRLSSIAHLIRTDPWGYPLVHPKGAFVVVLGAERRDTGTHYTPKSLTETIVETTLTPLVYDGPSSSAEREDWNLKSSTAILDLKVCDPTMGSGAFLVQACRFLSARLVEAWSEDETAGKQVDVDGDVHEALNGHEPMPSQEEARAEIARRLIAERCLYGVDLNPLAVELAKLSLWLVTLAKGRPFGFLDHNLRQGDSLIGITRIEQLTNLAFVPTKQQQGRLFGKHVATAVDEALRIRTQLRGMRIRDIQDVAAMAGLDANARAKVRGAERIADAFIGTVIETPGSRDQESRLAGLGDVADRAVTSEAARDELARTARRGLSWGTLNGVCNTFHWPLEYPEVFARANRGFDAFLGNPPFLGNRLWKGTHGPVLSRVVELVLGQKPGKVDLSVAFHRQATDLLRVGGTYGLLATNNIAEGSALAVGLQAIAEKGTFFWTRKGMPWPGTAATVIAIVCFYKGAWTGASEYDGQPCDRIGPRLQPELAGGWEPQPVDGGLYAFAGVDNSKGMAFVVTEEHPWFDRLRDEPNSLLRPYITGNDITSSSLTRNDRWALDIADRDLSTITSQWPAAHEFLLGEVKPTRTASALKSYKGLVDRWWQFWNHRAEQVRHIQQHDDCIVFCKVGKYPVCMVAPSNWIFTNKVAVVENSRADLHAILLSSLFRSWVKYLSVQSLGGDNSTFSLSISKAFSTFPLPHRTLGDAAAQLAVTFQDVLVSWSRSNTAGMTDALNAVHSRESQAPDIQELRSLFQKIDQAVVSAYGWDADLLHDFRDTLDGDGAVAIRHGLADAVELRLLTKLIKLNRERTQGRSSAQ